MPTCVGVDVPGITLPRKLSTRVMVGSGGAGSAGTHELWPGLVTKLASVERQPPKKKSDMPLFTASPSPPDASRN
jgi:hypothetical protein